MGLIAERDVTNDAISAYLTSQGVINRIDEDADVYVKDKNLGFPFWIHVERPLKLLVFTTFIGFGTTERAELALDRAQRLDGALLTVHFSLDDCNLHAQYMMSFREGAVDAHIFDAACRFSEMFMRAKNAVGGGSDEIRSLH
jgi:hypothetical protein